MSLAVNLSNFATRLATELKSIRTLMNGNAANLNALTTTNKTTLVAAINELVTAMGAAGAEINDATISTLTVWSSDKTDEEIDSRVSTVVTTMLGSAPAALDTLGEIATSLNNNADLAGTLTTLITAKAADSEVVKLAGNQTVAGIKTFSSSPVVPDSSFAIAKTTGLQTALDAKVLATDVGDTTTNLVTVFEAGLV